MKIASRFSMLCAAAVLLGALLSGCSPGPQGEEPLTLEHAHQMEAQSDPQKAVDEYAAIRNAYNVKDPEIAAQALLDSARFTSNPDKYGTPAQLKIADPSHLSAEAKDQLDSKHEQGEELARESLKQLQKNYPNSKAAIEATRKPGPTELSFKDQIDERVTRRNSTKLSYKIVDALVAATGRNPNFSYWFALAIIAVALKIITFPLLLKTYQSQREMQKMQPIIKELQAKYKDDPQELFRQQQAAFKEHGVNQFASCVPALIQMPIFFWMYSLIRVYEISFAKGHFLWVNPATAHSIPGGYIGSNLAMMDYPLLFLYAGTMFLTMRMTPQTDPQMAQQQKSMSVMMTFMMIWWFVQTGWPSAFLLYYLVQNILSAIQQYYFIYRPAKLGLAAAGGGGAAGMTIDVTPVTKSSSLVERPESRTNGVAKTNGSAKTAGAAAPLSASGMRPRPKRKSGKNR